MYEVIKKLPSGKAPGVNKTHPEMLKAMDIFWAVLDGMPVQCSMKIGNSDCGLADQGRGQKRNTQTGKAYHRVLERSLRLIVELIIQQQY